MEYNFSITDCKWGIPPTAKQHFELAKNSDTNILLRPVHLLLAASQVIPVAGIIAALAEKIIAGIGSWIFERLQGVGAAIIENFINPIVAEPLLMDAELQVRNRTNADRAVRDMLEEISDGEEPELDAATKLSTPDYDDLQVEFCPKTREKKDNELLAPCEILRVNINLDSDIRYTSHYQNNGYIVPQGEPEGENYVMNALDETFAPMHWNPQADANGFSKYVEGKSPTYLHLTGFDFLVHMAAPLNKEKYIDENGSFNETLYLKHMGKLFELMLEEQYQSGATDVVWDSFGLAEERNKDLQLKLAKEFVKAFNAIVINPRADGGTAPKLHLCLPVYNDKMIGARRAMLKALEDAQDGIYTLRDGQKQLKPIYADKFVLHVEEGLSDPISIAQKLVGLDVDVSEDARSKLTVSLACAVHAERLGGNWLNSREYNPASLEENLHLRSPQLAKISALLNRKDPAKPNQTLQEKIEAYRGEEG